MAKKQKVAKRKVSPQINFSSETSPYVVAIQREISKLRKEIRKW